MTDHKQPQWYRKLAKDFQVSADTIAIIVDAMLRGRGEQARFHVPELGGQGIWKRQHGAIIGNGFDEGRNRQATDLCNAIRNALSTEDSRSTLEMQSVTDTSDLMPVSIQPGQDEANWWPKEFGTADARGQFENLRYAYFAAHDRLVVQTSQRTRIFDTGGFTVHAIVSAGGADFMNATVKTDVGEFPLSKLEEVT